MTGFREVGICRSYDTFLVKTKQNITKQNKNVHQKLFPYHSGLLYYTATKFPKEKIREGNQEWRRNNLPYLNGDNLMPNNNSLYVVLDNARPRRTD